MAEEQKVKVEQVLRDALHHIRTGWVKKQEVVINGEKTYPRGSSVAGLRKLVEEGERVEVCAIGGVFLARTLAEPSGSRKKARTFFSTDSDPVVAQAIRLLAHTVNPKALADSLRRLPQGEEPDTELIVFSWNDSPERTKRQVTAAFSKAIATAHALGI